jgi:endogenous inhibitor of DNA gyrase (YacG/DUF329 family)
MLCPICRRETFAEGNPFGPFCSERCKLIDLDNWLSGRYRISAPVNRQEEIEGVVGSGGIAGESSESGE